MGADDPRVKSRNRVAECLAAVAAFRSHPPTVTGAAELAAAEQACAQCCDALHAALMAELTQDALDQPARREQARTLARSAPGRMKSAGEREVNVQFQRGSPVPLQVPYYRRGHRRRRGREKGFFPALVLLGIHAHLSPAATALMAGCACAVASLQEAVTWLRAACGLQVDVKTLRRITCRFGQRARAALATNRDAIHVGKPGGTLVISIDGGRLRVRRNKRGRRTRKGRQRYHTDWREPLLLHVHLLGQDGRLDRSFAPLIDGTLGGADAIFALLQLYLPLFNALEPTRVLLVADGARWIWIRFAALLRQGAIHCAQPVVQLIDFYHAVEHLGGFAEACTHWPRARRTAWRNQARKLLRTGQSDRLIEDMTRICQRHPRAQTLHRELRYFQHNRRRFTYAWARHLHLPIGSGPMESAIRRVINLRLKGPGIFWHEHTAEAMIMIRAYYKAQRWDELATLACRAPLEALL